MRPLGEVTMRSRVVLPLVWLLVVIAFAVYVWPTRWRYDHMTVDGNLVIVRIDRFDGNSDMLVPDEGWLPVEGTEPAPGTAPAALMARTDGTKACARSSFQMPVQPGVMRPSGDTAVASTTTRPAPPRASAARCGRCQSVTRPSMAEY